jgi:tyrosyl-tRNA synthetase
MSKSLGNYVGFTEAPGEIFGKMMSIPDELMWSYYELVTDRTPQQIATLKQEVAGGKLHPMDAKMRLAEEVISDFHGQAAARKAAENFQRVFRDRQAPKEMKKIVLKRMPMGISVQKDSESTSSSYMAPGLSRGPEKWSKLLAYLGEADSTSEAERLIKQGGFEIDGSLVKDPTCKLDLNQPGSYEVRVGKKKFLRIVVE